MGQRVSCPSAYYVRIRSPAHFVLYTHIPLSGIHSLSTILFIFLVLQLLWLKLWVALITHNLIFLFAMGSGASVAATMNENSPIHYPNQLMYRDITSVEGFIIQTLPDWNIRLDIPPRPSGSASSAEPHTFILFFDEYQRSFSHGPTHSERTYSSFPHIRPGIPPSNQWCPPAEYSHAHLYSTCTYRLLLFLLCLYAHQ